MINLESLENNKSPLIIFGAGIVGEVLLAACKDYGIEVDCLCDNNINKTKLKIGGKKIIHTSELVKKYKDAIFLISAADIQDVVEQLKTMGFVHWLPSTLLLRDYDIYKQKYSASLDFVEYAVGTCLLCQDNYLTPNRVFLRSVDVVVTQRCTMHCRDCSNLMRYYNSPVNYDAEVVLSDIDKLCTVVDQINEFRVIGGEPLLNKDVHLITERLIDEEKVKKIVIYTNGTMTLREEQVNSFKNKKILFFITDYEKLSRGLNELVNLLSKNGVAYYVQKAAGWTNCSDIVENKRSIDQNIEIFRNCCVKNSFTMMDGKLFRCPFSANANILKAVPKFVDDYIDIRKNLKSTKNKIVAFISGMKFLKTCDYCNGRSFGDTEIIPAIQQIEPKKYKQFNY